MASELRWQEEAAHQGRRSAAGRLRCATPSRAEQPRAAVAGGGRARRGDGGSAARGSAAALA